MKEGTPAKGMKSHVDARGNSTARRLSSRRRHARLSIQYVNIPAVRVLSFYSLLLPNETSTDTAKGKLTGIFYCGSFTSVHFRHVVNGLFCRCSLDIAMHFVLGLLFQDFSELNAQFWLGEA